MGRVGGVLVVIAVAVLIPPVAVGAPPAGLGGGGLIAFRSCEGGRSLLRVIRADGSDSRVVRSYPEFSGPLDCPWGKADWSWGGRRLLVEIPRDATSWAPGRRGVTTTSATPGPQAIQEYGLDGRLRGRLTPECAPISTRCASPRPSDKRTLNGHPPQARTRNATGPPRRA